MARDLHDETAQALVAIGRQLDLLLLDLDDRGRAEERIEALHRRVDASLEGVRRMSRNLRPAVLEDLGLVAALRNMAAEMAPLGLRVDVAVNGPLERLAPGLEYAIFRVAQEALHNVGATRRCRRRATGPGRVAGGGGADRHRSRRRLFGIGVGRAGGSGIGEYARPRGRHRRGADGRVHPPGAQWCA